MVEIATAPGENRSVRGVISPAPARCCSNLNVPWAARAGKPDLLQIWKNALLGAELD